MWLAPFQRNEENLSNELKNNTVFVSFEKMIMISCITFWNYAKSPKRGVKELEVFIDENLIYKVLINIK